MSVSLPSHRGVGGTKVSQETTAMAQAIEAPDKPTNTSSLFANISFPTGH